MYSTEIEANDTAFPYSAVLNVSNSIPIFAEQVTYTGLGYHALWKASKHGIKHIGFWHFLQMI